MNQGMLRSGKLLKDKEEMLRTVAECNLIMTDVLARVAVTDKFDIAWKDDHYGRIFDKLRDDYEIEERKEFLDEKVRLPWHHHQSKPLSPSNRMLFAAPSALK